MKTLILGCGYLGSRLAMRFLEKKHEVWVLRRDVTPLQALERAGAKIVEGDMLDKKTVERLPSFQRVVFTQAPSLPTDSYECTYVEATKTALDGLWRQEMKKVVFVSSTSVYGQNPPGDGQSDGAWVDEKTPTVGNGYGNPEAADKAKILLSAEQAVLDSGFSSIIFRMAGLYGPGRNRLAALRQGRFQPPLSKAYTNRIHVDDAVSAIELLFEKGKSGEIYLGADDAPVTSEEFYGWLAARLGVRLSGAGNGQRSPGRRCLNSKIKALGLKLRYPSYKEGYDELIRAGE